MKSPRRRLKTALAASSLRIFAAPPPDVVSPDHAWYDRGSDRHHVAIIPLERRDDALAMMPIWEVLRCELWYLCSRVEIGGADKI